MEERGSSPLVVLGMGGTIDKDYPRLTGGYAFEIDEPAAERILQALPLFGLEWSVKSVVRKDSTELTDADREQLVEAMRTSDASRVVVTHGTDTLIETARYVARSGAAAHKAVAFVGATKPERLKDSDASFNLGVAVGVTAVLPLGSVVIAMGGRIIDCMAAERDMQTGLFARTPSTAR